MAKLTPKKTTKPKSKSQPSRTKASAPKCAGRGCRKAGSSAKPAAPAGKLKVKAPDRPAVVAKAKISETAAVQTVQITPTSVTVSGKPVKNQAGLKSRELEYFRNLLYAKRRELLGDVNSMEEEALRSGSGTNLSNLPIHMADMGTDNYEQEFTLGLVQKDRDLLQEIDIALRKLRDGTYGICEGTGKPISKPRLEAKPWAKYSIEYTRKLEKSRMHG